MQDLRELYQEVIVDHGKNPRNFHELSCATHHANGFNRLCGDKLTLYIEVKDNVIKDISFVGTGCAISTASASLLTEVLKGKTIEEAQQYFTNFHHFITTHDNSDVFSNNLGKLAIFGGVREYPSRVKCATLAWHTLNAALDKAATTVTTEEKDL